MAYKDPEKQKEYAKKWAAENKDKKLKYSQKHWESNPKARMLNAAKYRAKKKGLVFDLTEDDIIIPEVCPLLKIPFTIKRGQGRVKNTIALDRIDSSKGYTRDNIQVLSHLANNMKHTATKEELIQFAKSILELYKDDSTP